MLFAILLRAFIKSMEEESKKPLNDGSICACKHYPGHCEYCIQAILDNEPI